MKKILYFALAVFIVFTSCKDDFGSSFADDPSTLPAATYMEMEEGQSMALWVELLKYTDMFNTMNLSHNYTCFVPDNDAITSYLTAHNVSNVNQLNIDDAKLLVRYHTIKGGEYSSVDFKDGLLSDSTASGDYLSSHIIEGGIIRINQESNVVNTIKVTNGYIHTINKVLTPVTETVWGVLNSTPEYSIMRDAFSKTGLKSQLDSIKINSRKIKYTLFAVPNNTYASENISDIEGLISLLGAGSDYTNPSNELYKYAAYHLLNQQMSYSVLAEYDATDSIRSKNYNTMAENQLINISEVNRTLYINYEKATATGSAFAQINKNTKNGVVHTINKMLTVKVPPASKVQWELTNYSDLTIIPFYRKAAGTSSQEESSGNLDRDLITCYTFMSVPESDFGWTYFLPNKNDAVRLKAKNSDYLVLSLGTFGWIEMESPVIIAGKYKVVLEHYNPRDTDKKGRLSIIIDGTYVGAQVATRGNSKTSDSFLKTTVGEVDFTNTQSHTVRILAGDGNDSELDCISFEPIH